MVVVCGVYMAYRIHRGHHIADLLLPHHEVQAPVPNGYAEKDTSNMIVCSQRFSVRSSRYAGSIRSAFSRHTQGSNVPTRSPYQQFNSSYYVKPYKAPTARVRSTPLVPPTLKNDLRTSTSLLKPALAHLDSKAYLSADVTGINVHGVAEEVVLSKPDVKRLTVTARPVSQINRQDSSNSASNNESISWKRSKSRGSIPKQQSITIPTVIEPTVLQPGRPISPQPSPSLMESITEIEIVHDDIPLRLRSHRGQRDTTFLLPATPTSLNPSLESVVRKWTH